METTLVGVILIISGVILFFFRPGWLYPAVVFFIPFSATSVINLNTHKLSLLVSMYYGILWITSEVFRSRLRRQVNVRTLRNRTAFLLILFGFIATVSLFMPICIDGSLEIYSASLNDYYSYPLKFSAWNVIHLFYLFYGITLAILVANKNSSSALQVRSTLRIYVLSGLVVSLAGIGELIFFKLGISYPLYILNTASSGSITETRVLHEIGIMRISSVAEEPSFLAQHLLSIMPISLFSVLFKQRIFSSAIDKTALLAMTVVLLLSASTTAYLGIVIILIVSLFTVFYMRTMSFRQLILLLSILALAFIVYYTVPTASNFIEVHILSKLDTGSGVERYNTVSNGWNYFLQYPIFGIGWGVVPVFDLIVKLLAWVGIVGLLSFLVLVFNVIRQFYRIIKSNRLNLKSSYLPVYAGGLMVSFITLLLVSSVSGFIYQLSFIWLTIGLAVALSSLCGSSMRVGQAPYV